MFNITKKSIEWAGRTLTLETGRIARQADGAVLATYGNTVVLCTVVAAKKPKPDVDFFPLTVNYQEKFYAAGRIPGGFFKREGRPTEKETLTSRLIDRPIRPLFPEGFYNETQVVCTLLSHDLENDPDIVALVGASAALTISGIPFMGPICGARVGYVNGEYVVNPTAAELEDSDLDLIVAGTQRSVLMVESEASELSEEVMLGAVMHGHKHMQPVINMIIEIAEASAKEPWAFEPKKDEDLTAQIRELAEFDLRAAYKLTGKQDRSNAIDQVKAKIKETIGFEVHDEKTIKGQLKKLEQDIVRTAVVASKQRIDGRGPSDIRPIQCEVGILPRTHGSALFTRGETQSIVVATLGTGQDEQIIDAVEGEYKQHFMLHYNFPPFSTGEVGRMGGPGRREIGHGKLAWRALNPILPTKEEFPYTLRSVSEITESNGSSSMATVCGTSLAFMDAGVPLARPVAGIAMGLIKEKEDFVLLSDILGDEYHLGDMDYKVAGTSAGITALQMDIKIDGITEEIMKVALEQAHAGRKHILSQMAKAITEPRGSVNSTAPRITTLSIPKDKIREVIGSGGKVIREICEVSGAKVDIDDDGTIKIAAISEESGKKAYDMIYAIVAEPEIGQIYNGKVVRIVDFGAFVNFLGPKDGLVHISELADYRVAKVEDVVKEGDSVKVKVLEMDNRGKIRLSMKVVDQQTGADISDQVKKEKKPA
ncbi:MAG: polyribonucleotide nucleotidyltransferase [Rickettsiales bacterium]|nr:polyribonucleotide nucleotidyltransferase [Rickettsiales bacterium]